MPRIYGLPSLSLCVYTIAVRIDSISYGVAGIFLGERTEMARSLRDFRTFCSARRNAMRLQQTEAWAVAGENVRVARDPALASHGEQPADARLDLGTLLFVAFAVAILAMLVAWSFAARAEPLEVTANRNAEQTAFSDAEIADGFFKVAFGAELEVKGNTNRIRKFEKPVRVFVDDRAGSRRRADIAAVVADIAARVDHLDLKMTDDRPTANVVVTLVRDQDALRRTLRSLYGRAQAAQIEQRLVPECLSGFGEDSAHRIDRAEVILSVNSGDFRFLDCAYEEILQALGPINDDRSVPWTMFNDEVQMGYFDVYDQYLLNILYDPRVRPGMTKQELDAVLPDVLTTARAWVARTDPALGRETRADSDQRSHIAGVTQRERSSRGSVDTATLVYYRPQ
jgi:Protein of unknown function (DUF2927)